MPIATPQGTLDFKSVDKVTFVGASSNTVIDTTTGSLGVGVGVGGPTSNLHVVGHTRLEGDIDMLHTANTASIKLNSNVVTEFSRSKKLIKYPRVNLTQNALNNGYAAAASSENNGSSSGQAYRAFDGNAGGERGYHSAASTYSSGSYAGSASITDAHGTQHQGEWIKLQMPTTEKMKLSGFSFSPRYVSTADYEHRAPYKGVFLGSTDGTNWYPIHHFDNVAVPELTTVSRTFENTTNDYYNHIALVAYEIGPNATYGDVLNFAEMELFGVPEYDPEAHGTDVVVKSVPNVPNTDWLEVYYDAKESSSYPGTGGTVVDMSGNSSNGTLNSVTFDNSVIQSFDIPDGGNISATLATIPSADFVHTVSLWVRFEGDTLTTSYPYVYFLGNRSDYSGFGLYVAGATAPNKLHVSCWTLDYPIDFTFADHNWYHVTYTYSGGGWGKGTVNVYVDGIEYGLGTNRSSGTEGTTPTIPTSNVPFRIGTSNTGGSFDGKIANIRLFNRALTSDEVWQLYSYQKEYFGHGDLSMTLKAGRLGIGTSEPRAALDVRGNVQVGGIITSNNPAFHVYRDDGDITTTDTTIVWNQVRFNRGNCYDSTTGVFHPPVDGMYYFSVFGITDSRTNAACSFRFQYAPPNGSFDYIHALWPYQYVVASSSHIHASASFVYFLEVGSSFRVVFHGTELLARGNSHNGFSGFLIG